jgi:transposase
VRPCSGTVYVDQPVERPHIRRLSGVATPLRHLVDIPFPTDKPVEGGYDADAIRHELADAEIEAVIPAKRNHRTPAPHDRVKYRWRNRIERLFSKLKNCRRIATRYDKTADSYIGFFSLASALLWLPFVHVA